MGYSGFMQGLEGPAHLCALLTTSPGLRDGCGLTVELPQSTGETQGRCLENHRAPPPHHSQHQRDDRVPSRSWPPGGPTPRQTQRKDAGTASSTPRPGVAWGSRCCSLCPSGSQAAALWSGSPWRPLLLGQTTSLATSTSGIAKKNKRSLRLAFFHSLVRLLVSRYRACQLGGRVSSCG